MRCWFCRHLKARVQSLLQNKKSLSGGKGFLEKNNSKRLLHRQQVTRLLDALGNATLMLCRQTGVLARKDFAGLSNKTAKGLYIQKGEVHWIAGTIKCVWIFAHA